MIDTDLLIVALSIAVAIGVVFAYGVEPKDANMRSFDKSNFAEPPLSLHIEWIRSVQRLKKLRSADGRRLIKRGKFVTKREARRRRSVT